MTDTAELAPPLAAASPLPPRAETAPPAADTVSPYLGLRSFSETDRELFHGREAETDELFHLVQRETVSVVFGVSGLGKSSLLRAGLFPRLRDAGLFPVAIRLTYGAGDLVAQIRAAIVTEIAEREVDASPPRDDQTLWEYFHRTPFWSARNRPLIPVIVLDQFEELFTLGHGAPGRRALLTELGDLIENRIPEAVRRTSDADALPPTFQVPKAKLILSLREDYLARLEDLRTAIPSIARGRFRLRPMHGAQALRAVRHARTEHLVDAAVAERIVRFVAGARGERAADTALDTLVVEPALLSLVCRQLDEVRRSRSAPTISADLLTGETGRILADFYDRAVHGLDPRIVAALEDGLITPDGHRTIVALSSLAPIAGLAAVVSALVDRRILRIEQLYGRDHVEVIHDVLTPVIVLRRDRRRDRAARRRRTRRLFAGVVAVSAATALTIGAVLYLGARHQLAEDRRRAAEATARSLAAEAAAVLSHGESWTAARLIDVAHGMVAEQTPPEIGVMTGRFTGLAPLLVKLEQPSSRVTAMAFSQDGALLFAGHQDGSVSIWSTRDWTRTQLQPGADAKGSAAPGDAGPPPVASATEPLQRDARPPVQALAVSSDGRFVAVIAGKETVIWNAREHTRKGTIAAAGMYVRMSDDGAVVQVNESWLSPEQLYLYQGRQYRRWPLPSISPSCKITMRPSVGVGASVESALLAISRDGKTLALYQSWSQSSATTERSRGALSLFALPVTPQQDRADPIRQATRCEQGERWRYDQLLINAGGSAIGLHSDFGECNPAGACDSVVICRQNARGELLPESLVGSGASLDRHPLAFDGRRPGLVLSAVGSEQAVTSLDGRMQRSVPSPCGRATQSDLSDGRLLTMGACGQFVLVSHEGAAVVGELPVTQANLIAVSAAAQLAAIATSDGALRVWRLEAPGRHLAQRGPTSLAAPLAWTQAFDAGARPGALPLLVTGDGRQAIAAAPAGDRAPAGASNAATSAIGVFDVSGTEIKPVRKLAADPSGAQGPPGDSLLELSPDGQRVLAVGRDGRVSIWDLEGRRVLALDDRPSGRVHHATYSRDGTLLATLADHRTCLWGSADGHLLGCASIGAGGSLVFDGEGRVIVADEDGTVKRWQPTGAPAAIGRSDAGARLAVDRDRRWLAAAERGALRVWDLQRCTAAGCPEVAHVQDSRGFEQARLVLAGDQAFVLGVGKADRAHVIDLGRPDVDHLLPLAGAGVHDVDVSRAGRALLCEADRVEEWDIVHRRLTGILALSDRPDATGCAARYAGDDRVITHASDGSLAVWSSGALGYGLAPPWSVCAQSGSWSSCDHSSVSSVGYTGEGRPIAYDGDLTRILAGASGDLVAAARSATAPAVTANGAMIVSRDGQLQEITSAGELEPRGRATRKPPRMLAIDAASGEALWIDADLQYRLVDSRTGQPLGPDRALATSLPSGALQALRYAPSGKWMLGARSDGSLTRFDIDGGQRDSERFAGGARWIVPAIHGDGLLAIGEDAVAAWTAEGPPKILHVTGGITGRAAAWDMATGTIILGLEDGLAAFDLAAGQQRWRSPGLARPNLPIAWVEVGAQASQPTVLAGSKLGWSRFRLGDGAALRAAPVQTASSTTAGWSVAPDQLLTLDANGGATLWETRNAIALSVTRNAVVRSDSEDPARVVRRPDGSFAAAGKSGASLLRIVGDNVSTEAELYCPGLPSPTPRAGSSPAPPRPGYAIAVSPEGRWVAAAFEQEISDAGSSATHHGICVWDTSAPGRQAVHAWDVGTSAVAELSFSHDGDRLLARVHDGPARLWMIPAGTEKTVFGHEDIVTAVYVRGQPYIATEDHAGNVRVYDARTGAPIAPPGKPLAAGSSVTVAVDAASGRLAMLDDQGDIAVIDVASGTHLRDWTSPLSRGAIAIAPGGRAVAVASGDEVLVWNPFPIYVPAALDAPSVIAMRFSPDGSWLATAGHGPDDQSFNSGMLRIWNIADQMEIAAFRTGEPLRSVAWSNDGHRVAAGGRDGYLETFDLLPEIQDHSRVHAILRAMAPPALHQGAPGNRR